MEITDLDQLKEWERNPRTISDKALKGLKASIKHFGNLAEITFNKRNGKLVCGHQRLRAIREEFDGQLKIENNVIVLPTGAKFPIQIVDLDEKEHAAANIAANNQHIAGDFNTEILSLLDQVQIDLPELSVDLNFNDLRLDFPFEEETIEFGEPPETVRENVTELERIREMRKKGNENVRTKTDTERYLVIVFPTRMEREKAVVKLGLPSDERYIAWNLVELRPRKITITRNEERNIVASPVNKAGATG
jgi:hypothetical protein